MGSETFSRDETIMRPRIALEVENMNVDPSCGAALGNKKHINTVVADITFEPKNDKISADNEGKDSPEI